MLLNYSVFLFAVALLTSKSLLTLMSTVLIVWFFVEKEKRQLWIRNKKIIAIVSLVPLAMLAGLFSYGGWQSAVTVIKSWPWPLLAAPAYCVYHSKILTSYFKKGLLVGLVLAVGYSFINLGLKLNSPLTAPFMSDNFRIASFWDISRWGYFSGLAVLILFYVYHQNFSQEDNGLSNSIAKRNKILTGILLTLTAVSFALTNTRATAVAVFLGLLFMAATNKKMIKTLALCLAAGAVFIFLTPRFQERLQSIFAVTVVDGQVSSNHASNAARFTMWKIAFDFFTERPFFGTGFDNTTAPLKQFLEAKGPSYTANYPMAEFSYSDQHSSYISMLVQMGSVFSVIFWSVVVAIVFSAVRSFCKKPDGLNQLLLAGIVYCGFIFLFYSALGSFEASAFFIILALLAG